MVARGMRQHSFIFEVTQRCNGECPHCYNVWESPRPYPRGELGTEETLSMLERMLVQSGAELVTLSGGEPLLRPDLPEIVNFLAAVVIAFGHDRIAIIGALDHQVQLVTMPWAHFVIPQPALRVECQSQGIAVSQ